MATLLQDPGWKHWSSLQPGVIQEMQWEMRSQHCEPQSLNPPVWHLTGRYGHTPGCILHPRPLCHPCVLPWTLHILAFAFQTHSLCFFIAHFQPSQSQQLNATNPGALGTSCRIKRWHIPSWGQAGTFCMIRREATRAQKPHKKLAQQPPAAALLLKRELSPFQPQLHSSASVTSPPPSLGAVSGGSR